MTLRTPKSEKANRWISLDTGTVAFLLSWRQKQDGLLGTLGLSNGDDLPVVTNKAGGFVDPSVFSRWRRNFFADHGFGSFDEETPGSRKNYKGLTLHDLRHLQATMLISSGTDMKTVQHRLGHSSISTTMDIYAHALAKNDDAAANQIGKIFKLKY